MFFADKYTEATRVRIDVIQPGDVVARGRDYMRVTRVDRKPRSYRTGPIVRLYGHYLADGHYSCLEGETHARVLLVHPPRE